MENKILISVNVPLLGQKFEVFIPVGKTVRHVIQLLEQGIGELSQNEYKPIGVSNLYNEQGIQIKSNLLVKNSGLVNGSSVIIV